MRTSILMLLVVGLQAGQSSPNLTDVRSITSKTPVDVQIALARSAGPPVGAAATVYVIGPHGYVRAVEGTNGFTCLVDRDRLDVLAPECFDAAGAPTLKVLFF